MSVTFTYDVKLRERERGRIHVYIYFLAKKGFWTYQITRFFHQGFFFFRMPYSRMTMLGFIWLKMWETSFLHMHWPPQSLHFDPIQNFGDCSGEDFTLGENIMQFWTEINVTLHNLTDVTSWQMCAAIKAKSGPMRQECVSVDVL